MLSTRPVRGHLLAAVTLFEVESMFVKETPIETPFPLMMEVVFRDTVSCRFALVRMLRVGPIKLVVVDEELVIVVVLVIVLVVKLVTVAVLVIWGGGLAEIVTVDVNVEVVVWVETEVEVCVAKLMLVVL